MSQTTLREVNGPASAPSQPLASWYAPGSSDALGDRLLMFDNSSAPSMELLRFRPDIADAPGFEAALREQVRRMALFEHPAFARIRAVQRLEPDGDLALISNHTPGKRLSEILHRANGQAFAAAMIRQLVPALADFQQHNPGAALGLLSPDRIIVSPDARVTIVEHAVGPALRAVGLRGPQLGAIGLSPGPGGDVFDPAGDWYRLGLVALSTLIGRPLAEHELPKVATLLGGMTVSPHLRPWIERALQIAGPPIESAEQGRAALAELLQGLGQGGGRRVAALPAPAPIASPDPGPTRRESRAIDIVPVEPPAPLMPPSRAGADRHLSLFAREADIKEKEFVAAAVAQAAAPPGVPIRVAAALLVIVLVQAGVIAWMARGAWATPARELAVEAASTAGATGTGGARAPLTIDSATDRQWVRITSAPAPALPGVKPQAGTLRVSSPIPLEVFAGSRTIGAFPGQELKLSTGSHDLRFVNEALGYRLDQRVQIGGGEGIVVAIAPPPGRVVFRAPVGTEVTLNGQVIGRTPLDPLTITPGEYQVTFKYAKGALDRQRAIVKPGGSLEVTARSR